MITEGEDWTADHVSPCAQELHSTIELHCAQVADLVEVLLDYNATLRKAHNHAALLARMHTPIDPRDQRELDDLDYRSREVVALIEWLEARL